MKQRKRTDMIIVHCTATPEGRDVRIEDIRKWHKGQGWADVGYHYVVGLDGTVCQGRAENLIGAHCSKRNAISIGIAYVGGCASDGKTPKDTRTEAQKKSLLNLVATLRSKYGDLPVYGHRDFSAKACPSFNAKAEYNNSK